MIAKLKKAEGYFNYQKQTLAGLLRDGDPEEMMPLKDRLMWGRMRMDPTDIADVTGAAYTYLVNGHGPDENRSEEHTSELQSLMRISYAVFCLKKKKVT